MLYCMDMADLTRDDILRLARLARISLNDEEISEFAGEFSEILRYVEQLDSVDTTGLAPTSQVTGLTNVSRPDEVIDYGYPAEKLLENVPSVEQEHIKVRRMIA
jgi:aspartyl-tRNA(Asn)/glutamyl-tRNA(Gln) amidotransferase subunit C